MDTVRATYRSGLCKKRIRRRAAWFIGILVSTGCAKKSRVGVDVLIFTFETIALLRSLCCLSDLSECFRHSVTCLQCCCMSSISMPFIWYCSVFVCCLSVLSACILLYSFVQIVYCNCNLWALMQGCGIVCVLYVAVVELCDFGRA